MTVFFSRFFFLIVYLSYSFLISSSQVLFIFAVSIYAKKSLVSYCFLIFFSSYSFLLSIISFSNSSNYSDSSFLPFTCLFASFFASSIEFYSISLIFSMFLLWNYCNLFIIWPSNFFLSLNKSLASLYLIFY